MIAKIHPLNPETRIIKRAAETMAAGEIIIYPTDTIYGMGCSIQHKDAIERIHLLKHQRKDQPFSFICSDLTHISEYAQVSNVAFKVMKHLIPGRYTFILPAVKMKQFPKILVSKRKTVGIRVPDSPITKALVKELGHPILSTSVTNESGELLNDPESITAEFQNIVELIIDGGPLRSSPSTILDLTGDTPKIIRMGSGDVSMLDI